MTSHNSVIQGCVHRTHGTSDDGGVRRTDWEEEGAELGARGAGGALREAVSGAWQASVAHSFGCIQEYKRRKLSMKKPRQEE